MPSEDTLLLNTKEERVRFRVKHYDTVYAYAFDATGSAKQAHELVERVFDAVERRHESSPIAVQCDSYLAAQVYLTYAQSDLASLSNENSFESKAPDLPPSASDSSAKPPFPGHSDSLSAACACAGEEADSSAQVSACKGDGERLLETAASSVPIELQQKKPPLAVPDPSLCELPSNEPQDASKASENHFRDAVYDESSTMFWTPGLELEPENEHKGVLPQEAVWVDEGETVHRSAFLSVLNGVLVLCSLLSMAFLLMELKLLPSLF